jgi:hypothetical protein
MILGAVVSLFASAGIYNGLVVLVSWAISRSERIKRLVLGALYISGAWVGYFRGEQTKKLRYFINYFEQSLEGLQMRGESFTEELQPHGSWFSDAAQIDVNAGRMIYVATVQILDRMELYHNLNVYSFHRNSPNDPPDMLSGYVTDIHTGTRTPITQWRVPDLPSNHQQASSKMVLRERALQLAKEKANEIGLELPKEMVRENTATPTQT